MKFFDLFLYQDKMGIYDNVHIAEYDLYALPKCQSRIGDITFYPDVTYQREFSAFNVNHDIWV